MAARKAHRHRADISRSTPADPGSAILSFLVHRGYKARALLVPSTLLLINWY
jgi:hypothetical protein